MIQDGELAPLVNTEVRFAVSPVPIGSEQIWQAIGPRLAISAIILSADIAKLLTFTGSPTPRCSSIRVAVAADVLGDTVGTGADGNIVLASLMRNPMVVAQAWTLSRSPPSHRLGCSVMACGANKMSGASVAGNAHAVC